MSNLFGGGRFFISRAVPQRTILKEKIERHGGFVVLLEKDADIILVDHMKKSQTHPPNALSYQYVEESLRRGRLEDPASHRVGPSAPRPVGASNIPTKSTRKNYSLEDDRIAFDWLYPWEQVRGAPTHGNKIYKNLAERFPQHTWQSWRSRYLRQLRGKPRPGGGVPRPDLVYGGPEAVPRIREMLHPPQAPEETPDSADTPLSHVPSAQPSPGPSNQSRPPADTSRKRGPPSDHYPVPSETARAVKKRLVEVEMQSPSAAHTPLNQPPQAVAATPALGTRPQKPSSPYVDTTVTNPNTNHHDDDDEALVAQKATTTAVRQKDEVPELTVDPLFRHLPFFPSSSEPEDDEDAEEAEHDDGDDDDDSDLEEYPDISSWVNAQVAKGADMSTVLDALRYTSMEPILAKKLLKILLAGQSLPENMRGVWTEDDDRCLESQDSRDVRRVVAKHGDRLFQARWEYLEMARERGLV